MADQKKKTNSTKNKAKAKSKSKTQSKNKTKTKPEGLPAVLKTAVKGWRKVEAKRIELLEESVSRYFDARHSLLDAKSIRERAKIRSDFTREAVSREIQNVRKLGELHIKAGRDTFETLRDVVPQDPKKAIAAIRDALPKVNKKAA